jgi:hypothetical protein
MNIRLKYNMDWRSGIWFEDRLQMNNYGVTLSLITNTNDQEHQIVAISRLKWFVYQELESTVFVHQNDTDTINKFNAAGINITTLPEQPIDQIVGLMLFAKFNAIMEDRLVVKELDIVSDLGDNIHYLHSDQETTFFDLGTGWWNDSGPNHCIQLKPNQKNVVKLKRVPSWRDHDLEWDSDTDRSLDIVANTVVKFNRDEN